MVGYPGAFEIVDHTAETKSDKVVGILREIKRANRVSVDKAPETGRLVSLGSCRTFQRNQICA
jgi:hypothetical protein